MNIIPYTSYSLHRPMFERLNLYKIQYAQDPKTDTYYFITTVTYRVKTGLIFDLDPREVRPDEMRNIYKGVYDALLIKEPKYETQEVEIYKHTIPSGLDGVAHCLRTINPNHNTFSSFITFNTLHLKQKYRIK